MIKDYVNDKNLQIAMTEYDSEMDLDHVVKNSKRRSTWHCHPSLQQYYRSGRAGLCSCKKSQRKC